MEPRLVRRGNEGIAEVTPGWQAASMEPRLVRRGNVVSANYIIVGWFGFNGATSRKTWKRDGDQHAVRRPGHASMEPRLVRRGNVDKIPGWEEMLFASMEPRLVRRGNAPGIEIFNGDRRRLQWSHVS